MYIKYIPKYFPIVHPSPLNFRWQAKNPWFLEDVVPVLRKKVSEILSQNSYLEDKDYLGDKGLFGKYSFWSFISSGR